jgi:hypothetical protein
LYVHFVTEVSLQFEIYAKMSFINRNDPFWDKNCHTYLQCCGYGRFLIGSVSDFWKRPNPVLDPDPDLNKFSNNFLHEIFMAKICSKKYFHEPKSWATDISKVFLAFTHTKIVDVGSFIRARTRIRPQTSGFDQKGPDPIGSGSVTLPIYHFNAAQPAPPLPYSTKPTFIKQAKDNTRVRAIFHPDFFFLFKLVKTWLSGKTNKVF